MRQEVRKRWFSGRAVALHLAILVWFPGCLAAGWWQVNRAFDGNGLSYLYSVEWPVFAVVGVWGWWMLIHTDPDTVGRRAQEKLAAANSPTPNSAAADSAATDGPTPSRTTTGEAEGVGTMGAPLPPTARRRDEEDDALAAYNDRLADLATRGPKTWRNR